jgi:putative toxin-antitoxin system antitoxin component (TIGR02293 family)
VRRGRLAKIGPAPVPGKGRQGSADPAKADLPHRTGATYKRQRDLLKLEESEHTERLARVLATAEYVWDNEEESRRFLTTPNPALGGLRPIDTAYTELGARQVEELLWQIFYGLPL